MNDPQITQACSISDAEWEIMRTIWADPGISSRQIIDIILEVSDWKAGTIKSLINRLLQKGFIVDDKSHRPYRYYANITQEEAVLININKIFNRFCDTRNGDILYQIISQSILSNSQCQDLANLLLKKSLYAPSEVACSCPPGQCECKNITL